MPCKFRAKVWLSCWPGLIPLPLAALQMSPWSQCVTRGGVGHDASPAYLSRDHCVAVAFLDRGQDRPCEWGWGMHTVWGVWRIGLMVMMLVLFWGVVIAGIVLAIRWMVSHGRQLRPTDAALDILRQRYARGDITQEEF